MADQAFRPLERRIRRLQSDGMPDAEIAERFRRSPDFIRRVVEMSALRGPTHSTGRVSDSDAFYLRPVERRVLRWRSQGASFGELAPRFQRSPEFLQQIERLARHKLSTLTA